MNCSTPGFPPLHYLVSLLKLMSVESMSSSNHLILCHPFYPCSQYLPASESFPVCQFFTSGGQTIGVSTSASILPVYIQDWFPLGWTGWISMQPKGLSSLLQHHSSKASILRCSAFFIVQLSHPYMTAGKPITLPMSLYGSLCHGRTHSEANSWFH